MAGLKPNNFPLKNTIDGTEEIYTQTNDTNEKFTVEQVKQYTIADISGYTDAVYTETVVTLDPSIIVGMGTTPYTTPLSLTGNNYFDGEFEIIYQAGNLPYDTTNGGLNVNGIIYLVAYTANVFSANVLLDGVLFYVNLLSMATTAKTVAKGGLNIINLFSNITTYTARHFPNGTVKFIMVDETFTPIDIVDGNGSLKITLKTRVKPYN